MDKYVAVFRDEEGIKQALEIVKRLKEEAESVYIDDRGAVFNQDVLGALELGYMLDNAECDVRRRAAPRPRAAAPSTAPTSRSETTTSGSSTST